MSCKHGFLRCLMSISELMFLETSALTGENVEEAFVQCARKILNKIESGNRRSINQLPQHTYFTLLNSVTSVLPGVT